MLIALALRTGTNLKVIGMPALFAMIVFFLVWVVGNLVEVNSSEYHWMLWGRNIQQIGVFFTPLCTLYFSIGYTGNRRLGKFAYVISVIQVISVILIFTDQYHHIMRASVVMQTDAVFGRAIAVRSTKIGSALVAFNFCIPLIALANLTIFTRTVSAKLRRPLWLIIISIFATFVIAAVQSTLLSDIGINIPIPVLNLPCVVLLSYVILRGGFIGVAPTAFNKVFEVVDQGIIVVDVDGKVIEYNRRASELMEDIVCSGCINTGSDIMELMSGQGSAAKEGFSIESLPAELKNAQRNRYISLAHHTLETFRGRLAGYVIVLTDITQLKVRAEIDCLTGSYNREGLTNAFSDLQKHAEGNPYVSAMIIDLDNFKSINDTFGHSGGDVILRDFVSTAQSLLSEKYFLARLGGDEFVIVLSAEVEVAVAVAERLRKCVSERIVQFLNHKIQYTISVGVASCPNGECLLSDLLHKADLALYKSKQQGKNLASI
jgi:diguanylate cyclase (GGDEF)-like protein